MKNILVSILFSVACSYLLAQQKDQLFIDRTPLNLALTMSIKEIAGSKEDSTYISHMLYLQNEDGSLDSIPCGLKGRGNYRLKNCFFPPLWIKMKKGDIKGTIFEGNKKLKLVMPCDNAESHNDLILRESLCYRLYEVLTPYSFRTRLVNIDLTELRGKRRKNFQVKGILIEDLDEVADRFDAKELKESRVHSKVMNDTGALRFDLFQFMIANTDWSKSYQHNSKLILHQTGYFSIPYDFDMSGLVDAPYATVSVIGNEPLPISHVTERFYRGHCRGDSVTRFVRNEFITKEEAFLAVPGELKGQLSDKELAGIVEFLNEFFVIAKDDKQFHDEVIRNCRE